MDRCQSTSRTVKPASLTRDNGQWSSRSYTSPKLSLSLSRFRCGPLVASRDGRAGRRARAGGALTPAATPCSPLAAFTHLGVAVKKEEEKKKHSDSKVQSIDTALAVPPLTVYPPVTPRILHKIILSSYVQLHVSKRSKGRRNLISAYKSTGSRSVSSRLYPCQCD